MMIVIQKGAIYIYIYIMHNDRQNCMSKVSNRSIAFTEHYYQSILKFVANELDSFGSIYHGF